MTNPTANRAQARLFVLAVAATLGACAGSHGQGDDDDDSDGSSPSVTSSIAGCTGTYSCNLYESGEYEGEFDGRLVRKGTTCVLQASDSTAMLDLAQATVTKSTFTFVDSDSDRVACWAPAAKCTGVASSCSAVGSGACYHQDGCHYSVNSVYSTTDDSCDGSATSCTELSTEFTCHDQSGCVWE